MLRVHGRWAGDGSKPYSALGNMLSVPSLGGPPSKANAIAGIFTRLRRTALRMHAAQMKLPMITFEDSDKSNHESVEAATESLDRVMHVIRCTGAELAEDEPEMLDALIVVVCKHMKRYYAKRDVRGLARRTKEALVDDGTQLIIVQTQEHESPSDEKYAFIAFRVNVREPGYVNCVGYILELHVESCFSEQALRGRWYTGSRRYIWSSMVHWGASVTHRFDI